MVFQPSTFNITMWILISLFVISISSATHTCDPPASAPPSLLHRLFIGNYKPIKHAVVEPAESERVECSDILTQSLASAGEAETASDSFDYADIVPSLEGLVVPLLLTVIFGYVAFWFLVWDEVGEANRLDPRLFQVNGRDVRLTHRAAAAVQPQPLRHAQQQPMQHHPENLAPGEGEPGQSAIEADGAIATPVEVIELIQVGDVRTAFSMATGGKNCCNLKQFTSVLEKLNIKLDEKRTTELFVMLDADGTNEIGWNAMFWALRDGQSKFKGLPMEQVVGGLLLEFASSKRGRQMRLEEPQGHGAPGAEAEGEGNCYQKVKGPGNQKRGKEKRMRQREEAFSKLIAELKGRMGEKWCRKRRRFRRKRRQMRQAAKV